MGARGIGSFFSVRRPEGSQYYQHSSLNVIVHIIFQHSHISFHEIEIAMFMQIYLKIIVLTSALLSFRCVCVSMLKSESGIE